MKFLIMILVLMTSSAFAATGACDSKDISATCVYYDGPDFLINAMETGCAGQAGTWVDTCPEDGHVCELNQSSFNMEVHLYELNEAQAKQGCDAMGGKFIGM